MWGQLQPFEVGRKMGPGIMYTVTPLPHARFYVVQTKEEREGKIIGPHQLIHEFCEP
jgi:hypothetical protein